MTHCLHFYAYLLGRDITFRVLPKSSTRIYLAIRLLFNVVLYCLKHEDSLVW
jgi:hypothetical protein